MSLLETTINKSLRHIPESKNKARLKELTGKVSAFQANVTETREQQKDSLEMRLDFLDEKVARSLMAETTKFNLLKEQIDRIQEALSAERAAREVLDERKTKELRLFETNINIELNNERNTRNESESIMFEDINSSCDDLAEHMVASSQDHANKMAEFRNMFLGRTKALIDKIDTESTDRESRVREITSKLDAEFSALTKKGTDLRRVREETAKNLKREITQISTDIAAEIDAERAERESVEETLLVMLEETCRKVDE